MTVGKQKNKKEVAKRLESAVNKKIIPINKAVSNNKNLSPETFEWIKVDSEQKKWINQSWKHLKTVQRDLMKDRISEKNPTGVPSDTMSKSFKDVVDSGLKLLNAERSLYINEQMQAEAEKVAEQMEKDKQETMHHLIKKRIDEYQKRNVS